MTYHLIEGKKATMKKSAFKKCCSGVKIRGAPFSCWWDVIGNSLRKTNMEGHFKVKMKVH